MKTLISAIEQADCSVSLAITASTLDAATLAHIRASLKDLSESFSVASDMNKSGVSKGKASTSHTGMQTPRINAQAPTPIKGSFMLESMARSSSHDRIAVKPKFPQTCASSRDVPVFRPKDGLPLVEVTLKPELLVPNLDDNQFNNFLETELERIKQMFLDEPPMSKSSPDRGVKKEKQNKTKKEAGDSGGNDLVAFLAQSSRKQNVKKGSTRGPTLQR